MFPEGSDDKSQEPQNDHKDVEVGKEKSSGQENETEVFSNIVEIVDFGRNILKSDTGNSQIYRSTINGLEDISEFMDSLKIKPETFVCMEFPDTHRNDKFGNPKDISTFRLFGEGDLGLEVRVEKFSKYEQIRQGFINAINASAAKILELRFKAGAGNVPSDIAESMFNQADSLGEKSKKLRMQWVRKIDFTLLEDGRDGAGITFVDAPGGVGVTVRDRSNLDVLMKNQHGFVLDNPEPMKANFNFDEILDKVQNIPAILSQKRRPSIGVSL